MDRFDVLVDHTELGEGSSILHPQNIANLRNAILLVVIDGHQYEIVVDGQGKATVRKPQHDHCLAGA